MTLNPLQLLRTDPAHVGSAPISSLNSLQQKDQQSVGKASKTSFQEYLVEAVQYVNGKQMASSEISNQLIIDPDSVDIHDVTIAMAEASLSLNMAQNVIDRIVKGWNEITTTR